MNRRNFLKTIAGGVAAVALPSFSAGETTQPGDSLYDQFLGLSAQPSVGYLQTEEHFNALESLRVSSVQAFDGIYTFQQAALFPVEEAIPENFEQDLLAHFLEYDELVTSDELGVEFSPLPDISTTSYASILATEWAWFTMEEDNLALTPENYINMQDSIDDFLLEQHTDPPAGIDLEKLIWIKIGAIIGLTKKDWDAIKTVFLEVAGPWIQRMGQQKGWKWLKFCLERLIKALLSKKFFQKLVQAIGEKAAKKFVAAIAKKIAGALGLLVLIVELAKALYDQVRAINEAPMASVHA